MGFDLELKWTAVFYFFYFATSLSLLVAGSDVENVCYCLAAFNPVLELRIKRLSLASLLSDFQPVREI